MRIAFVSAALLAFAAASFAQVNTSVMDGTVTDPQGSLVPRAQVIVTNTLNGQTFTAVTDDKGHWAIPALPTATYSVAVSAPGFKKVEKTDIKMDAGIPATVNL